MKYLNIVSTPHGGSTLLSLVLGGHPDAANMGEVSFIPKLLATGELCTCGTRLAECAEWSKVFDDLTAHGHPDMRHTPYAFYLGDAIKDKHGAGLVDHEYQTARREKIAKIRGAIEIAGLLGSPNRYVLRALTPPAVKSSIANTLRFYEAAATAWGKKLVIDASKFPRKAVHLSLTDPERVRTIHLTRDGRAVVASRIRYMSASRAAQRWNYYHRLTRSILHRWVTPADRRQIRYEDFVADPETELRALCDWLGVEYASSLVHSAERQIQHSSGGNPARFEFTGEIRPADQRWRKVLSRDQLERVERIVGPLNREFGYE